MFIVPPHPFLIFAVGVLETTGYYSGDWSKQLDSFNATLDLFYNGCYEAGPELCGFYANSSAEIEANILSLLEVVRLNPVSVYNGPDAPYGIVDYATLKEAIERAAYSPYNAYQTLSFGLAALAQGNGTIIFGLTGQEVYTDNDSSSNIDAPYTIELQREAELAISCADIQKITDGPEELMAYYESIAHISWFEDALIWQRTRCSGWKVHPEHFSGPITGNTSFPILFIGNTADPVTPVSAYVVFYSWGSLISTFPARKRCPRASLARLFLRRTLAEYVCVASLRLLID